MRRQRLGFIFLAFYFTFLGGSAYYYLAFPIRVLHHVVVTVLMGLWLVGRLRRGQGLPASPLNRPLYAAVGVWFIASALSLDPRMAFENIWFPLTHLMIFFVLLDLFQCGRQRLVMETVFMMATTVVAITVMEVVSWYTGGFLTSNAVGWADVGVLIPPELPVVSLAMNISTLLAGYVTPLILVSLTWALTTRRRDYRRVLFILAGLLLVVLILTFSRGGLLAFLAGLGTLILFRLAQWPRLTDRVPARVTLGAGVAIGAAGMLVYVGVVLPYGRGQSDEGRLDMWRSAVEMTRDYPLTGVGPGMFGRALRDYRNPDLARDKLASAHNAYLNTASETGLAGVVVSVWMGGLVIWLAWGTWRRSSHPLRRLRIEGVFAALVALATHSMIDAFTITPIVLLMLVFTAYVVTGHRSRLAPPIPSGGSWPAVVALLIVVGYGLWFLLGLDRAQAAYMSSLQSNKESIGQVRLAADIDPALNLYPLHMAHLSGILLPVGEAELAYQRAVDLEPTWDTGWINLAALAERRGDFKQALVYLEQAWAINPLTPAPLHWARIAEQTELAPEQDIVNAYLRALGNAFNPHPPLSEFWWATPLRETALERYLDSRGEVLQYRVFTVYDPARAIALVPDQPESHSDWWIAGHYALTVEQDYEKAAQHFSQAIVLNPGVGDYYVSRAEAAVTIDPDSARADLDMAQLLGTRFEYPNVVRAQLAATEDERTRLLATALPGRSVRQELAAVLYNRVAVFDRLPEMRWPGPGRAALDPWYVLAYGYLADGDVEGAKRAFRFILDYAPYETEAQDQLVALGE